MTPPQPTVTARRDTIFREPLASAGCARANDCSQFPFVIKGRSPTLNPMSDKFQYRAVQHNGSKRFEDQTRVLTYRGATYQTRVFEVRYEALKAS